MSDRLKSPYVRTYMDTFATLMILGPRQVYCVQSTWTMTTESLAMIISVALQDFVSPCSFPIGRLFCRPWQLNAKFPAPSDVYRRQSLLARPWQLSGTHSVTFLFFPWPKISWVYVTASSSKRESVWVAPGDAKLSRTPALLSPTEAELKCFPRSALNFKTSTSTWTGSRGDLNDEPRRVPANSQLIF